MQDSGGSPRGREAVSEPVLKNSPRASPLAITRIASAPQHEVPASPNRGSLVVKLNIGGFKYLTTAATLASKGPNFFTALLNGSVPTHKDEEGYIFVDRNGRYFEPLLDYFRTGELYIPEGMREESVLLEADFYLIEPLRQKRSRLSPHVFGMGQGHRLKRLYQQSQGIDPIIVHPPSGDDIYLRIFAPAFPLMKFAARLGFPGFAVEIRSESDTGIQAYYDIFGSKAMPSGLIKLDIAPSSPLAKELYTDKGREALEAYLRKEGFERVSSHYDTNRGSIVVSIGW